MDLNTAHFQAVSHRIVILPSPKLSLLHFVVLLFSVMSPHCDQWKIWLGRWDISWGKAVHQRFTTAPSAAVWLRKKLWGLIVNNQEIVQTVSRAGAVSSSPLLTKEVAARWWERQLPAAAGKTKKKFPWAKTESFTLPCLKLPIMLIFTWNRYYKGNTSVQHSGGRLHFSKIHAMQMRLSAARPLFSFNLYLFACSFFDFSVLIYRAKSLWCWAVRLSEIINSLYADI